MIWGVLGVGASAASQAVLNAGAEERLTLVWAAFLIVGLAATAMFSRREQGRTRTRTFAERVLSATWVAIAITLVAFCAGALVLGAMPAAAIPGAVAFLLATGLSVMGAVLEFRLLYGAAAL